MVLAKNPAQTSKNDGLLRHGFAIPTLDKMSAVGRFLALVSLEIPDMDGLNLWALDLA